MQIVEIIHSSKYGKTVLLEGDAREYHLEANQKWLPHTVDNICSFKPGQIVSVENSLVFSRLNVSAVIVAKTRTMKDSRKGKPFPQIEIVGWPLRWWHAGHFAA